MPLPTFDSNENFTQVLERPRYSSCSSDQAPQPPPPRSSKLRHASSSAGSVGHPQHQSNEVGMNPIFAISENGRIHDPMIQYSSLPWQQELRRRVRTSSYRRNRRYTESSEDDHQHRMATLQHQVKIIMIINGYLGN